MQPEVAILGIALALVVGVVRRLVDRPPTR